MQIGLQKNYNQLHSNIYIKTFISALEKSYSQISETSINFLKSFQANVPFLYPLKTSENLWFSDVCRGYRNGTLASNGSNFHLRIVSKNFCSLSFNNLSVFAVSRVNTSNTLNMPV